MTKQAALNQFAALLVKHPDLIAAILGKPVAKASPKAKPAVQPKAAWNVEEAAIKAAEKAGFAGAKPRVDLLTAKAWIEKGYRPKAGSKAIRVKKPGSAGKGMPLFHKEQVELAA